MNKLKNFGRLIKFEFVRLFRNKVVVTLLLLFALVLIVVLSSSLKVDDVTKELKVSIYTGGKNLSEISSMAVIEDKFDSDNFIMVESIEEGIYLVEQAKVMFFIEVDSSTTPETLVLHYDGYSNASMMIKDRLNNQKNEYSYKTITTFLERYGITINRSVFESINFESINDSNGWSNATLFVFGLSAGISVIIMFGLAYSISRDTETSVNKIMSYMPISSTKFIWSKIFTYLIIGIIEMIVVLMAGILLFGIELQTNIFIILFMSILFIFSTIVLGIIFSSFKGQIMTVLCSVGVILLPLILLSSNIIQGIILPVRIFLYMMPMTPFIELLHGMLFNGIINWISLGILMIQSVVYYFLSYFLLRRNVKNN